MEPNGSFLFSAPLSGVADEVAKGDCLISDGGSYVLSTIGVRGVRRTHGIAWAGGKGSVNVRTAGLVPASISGLGPGAASWIRVSDAGRLERFTPSLSQPDDDVVGRVEADGSAFVAFGTMTVASVIGGNASAVASNIKKSAGTTIDTVKGENGPNGQYIDESGNPLADDVMPPKGGSFAFSPRGGVNGMRAKKPVPPGYWDLEDFGAVPDRTHGRTVTAASGSPNITLSSTVGLFVGQKLRLAAAVTRTVLSITNATDAVLTANAGVDTVDGACYTDNADAFDACHAVAEVLGPVGRGVVIHATGDYYFSRDLHIRRGTILSGCGQTDENKTPGTHFAFGPNCTGIREHSATLGDDPTSNAGYSCIYDMTISCLDRQTTGHGIHASTIIFCQNVGVFNFAENNLELQADTTEKSGNASTARFFGCRFGSAGRHNVHIRGGDANICNFVACSFQAAQGVGVYDESGLGNVYTGCHAEGNVGNFFCRATTTMGSADIVVDDAQLLWFGRPYLDSGAVLHTGSLITIPGVSGTKEVTNIVFDTRSANITDATNASPIVIESVGHGFNDGDYISIKDVDGNVAANGPNQKITLIDADHFSLNGSTGSGAYTGGGVITGFPAAVVTLDSVCDASVVDALVMNVDGRNHDYFIVGQGTNTGLLLGCYSEASVNKVDKPSMVLGGVLAQQAHVGSAHVNNAGTLKGLGLKYRNTKGAAIVEVEFGADDDTMRVLTFTGEDLDYYALTYVPGTKRWALIQDQSSAWHVMEFPTSAGHERANAVAFPNGQYIGSSPAAPISTEIYTTAATVVPTDASWLPATWHQGDRVLKSGATAGGNEGWVCTVEGTNGTLNGGLTTADTTNLSPDIVVNDTTDLLIGQFITIAGVTGVKKIVGIAGTTVTVDVACDADTAGAAVAFSPPTFKEFGAIAA